MLGSSNTGFNFGQTPTTTASTFGSTPSFGTGTTFGATTSLFGQTQQSQPTQPSLFGQSQLPTQQATTPFGSFNFATPSVPPVSTFGSSTFGQAQTSQTSGFAFGTPQVSQANTGQSMFGSNVSAPFGGQQTQPTQPTGSLFASSTSALPSQNLFGQPAVGANNVTNVSTFGTTTGTLFSTQPTTTAPTSVGFGGFTTPSFGQVATTSSNATLFNTASSAQSFTVPVSSTPSATSGFNFSTSFGTPAAPVPGAIPTLVSTNVSTLPAFSAPTSSSSFPLTVTTTASGSSLLNFPTTVATSAPTFNFSTAPTTTASTTSSSAGALNLSLSTPSTSTPAFNFSNTFTAAPTVAPVISTTTNTTTSSGSTGFNFGAVTSNALAPVSTSAPITSSVSFGPPTTSTVPSSSFNLGTFSSTASSLKPSLTTNTTALSLSSSIAPSITTQASSIASTSTVASVSLKPSTGFSVTSLGTNTAISTAVSGTTATVSTAAPPPITFGKLEDQINLWMNELAQFEADFHLQGQTINSWDSLLISNGQKLIEMKQSIEKLRSAHRGLDHQLDFIIAQQKELEQLLEQVEQNKFDMSANVNAEREHTYSLVEVVNNDLNAIGSDLKDFIKKLNETKSNQDSSDPIVQISKILNAHMDVLQWIENQMKNVKVN